ncbi:MAG: hypothetical protein K2Y39_15190 [Candidatus Obscuribacterales bacterium]|nr:hypothetical protein [Candidatus Obscuribacterales bacterium]
MSNRVDFGDLKWILSLTIVYQLVGSAPAQAYFDPAVTSYLAQSLAAVAFFFILGFRRFKTHIAAALSTFGAKKADTAVITEEDKRTDGSDSDNCNKS